MHIPEIKSISRRSRLHSESSKELKPCPSSFDAGLFAPSLFLRCCSALLNIPCLSASLRRHVHRKQSSLSSPCLHVQPSLPSLLSAGGIVTKNTTLETLPCTHQTLIFQTPYINRNETRFSVTCKGAPPRELPRAVQWGNHTRSRALPSTELFSPRLCLSGQSRWGLYLQPKSRKLFLHQL